jgi:hypothetical protein
VDVSVDVAELEDEDDWVEVAELDDEEELVLESVDVVD